VAFAAAVGAAKTSDWCAVFADARGGSAFFCFVRLFEKDLGDFCGFVGKQVVDVPEQAFFAF